MSLQVQLAELRTLLAGVADDVKEIKTDLKEGAGVMSDHNLRIDRLEQKQKARSKLFWAAATSWVGLAVAGVWDRLTRR